MQKLKINEIFKSPQGEGFRAGTENIFIRTTGCNAKYACYALGVRCDTDFESGSDWEVGAILELMRERWPDCKNIIWTGGEPAQQLNDEIVAYFKRAGYYQSIETSGLYKAPEGIDYVVVSPKVAEHVIAKNFDRVNELRYVRDITQAIPQPAIEADHYYLSPHFEGNQISEKNLEHCLKLAEENPQWKVSVQRHKISNLR